MTRYSATQLGRWRIRNGFKRAKEAAEHAGCSTLHLLAIEEGRKNPSDELLERMAPVYGKSLEEMKRGIRRARMDLMHRQLRQLEEEAS